MCIPRDVRAPDGRFHTVWLLLVLLVAVTAAFHTAGPSSTLQCLRMESGEVTGRDVVIPLPVGPVRSISCFSATFTDKGKDCAIANTASANLQISRLDPNEVSLVDLATLLNSSIANVNLRVEHGETFAIAIHAPESTPECPVSYDLQMSVEAEKESTGVDMTLKSIWPVIMYTDEETLFGFRVDESVTTPAAVVSPTPCDALGETSSALNLQPVETDKEKFVLYMAKYTPSVGGLHYVCVSGGSTYAQAAQLDVVSSNVQYFTLDLDDTDSVAQGMSYKLMVVGIHLNLQPDIGDRFKVVQKGDSCTNGTALDGTSVANFGPNDSSDAQLATGILKPTRNSLDYYPTFCYYTAATKKWSSVRHYMTMGVRSRNALNCVRESIVGGAIPGPDATIFAAPPICPTRPPPPISPKASHRGKGQKKGQKHGIAIIIIVFICVFGTVAALAWRNWMKQQSRRIFAHSRTEEPNEMHPMQNEDNVSNAQAQGFIQMAY